MAIATYGPNAVDWEERVELGRLRDERLARLRSALELSDLGAVLSFDFGNIRYMTATHIGTWAMDKLIRFALLVRGREPIIWDFGSAARHHQLYNPWLDRADAPTGARAGISTLRGAFHPGAGIAEDVARKVVTELREHGVAGDPLGIDVVEMPVLAALRAEGIDAVDGQQLFLEARRTKTRDEIALLTQACSMVDAAYERLYEFLRPGVRENECVGVVSKVLYDLGSEYVEGVNAISGERCSPHPHVYSDRIIRPGDPAFFDILHSHLGYRTCYYRTFAVGSASRAQRDAYVRCREYMDEAISLVKPGATTADIVSVWPRAQEFGFPDEEAAFALQYGHGVGLSIWRSRSSAAWCRWTTPRSSRRACCSPWRPTGPRLTAGRRRGSRRRSWSPATAARSSPSSPPRNCWWPGSATGPWTAPCPPCARRSPIATGRPARGTGDHGRRRAHPRAGRPRAAGRAPGRGAARAVGADGADPRHREGRLRPVHGGPGQGHHPPRLGPGGGRGRRQRRAPPRRLRVRHLPGPPPRHRQGRQPRGLPCRADEPGHRPLRRQGRLHAPHHGLAQHARLLRDRRRPPPDRLRRGLVGQAPGHRAGRRRLLRRRRHQHRRLPRGPQPGRRLAAAGAVHLREQPLHGVHLDPGRDRRGPAGRRPGARLRPARRGGRRQRRRGRAARRGRCGSPGPRRQRADRDRGAHLPAVRPLPGRPRHLPAQGGGRRLAASRPAARARRAAP